eukprot:2866690-Prymnesium_polylepis.2
MEAIAAARESRRIRQGNNNGFQRTRVRECKNLRHERLNGLCYPRYVANEKRTAGDAVEPRTALNEPQQHCSPPRQERVDDRIAHAHPYASAACAHFAGRCVPFVSFASRQPTASASSAAVAGSEYGLTSP